MAAVGAGHKYYLAHATKDRLEVRNWEKKAEDTLDIILLNPFYDSEATEEKEAVDSIDKGLKGVYDPSFDHNRIVKQDIAYINECSGLVAIITDSLTVGAYMEIFYNSYCLRRPSYLIIENKELQTHPWLVCMAEISGGRLYTSRQEFIDTFSKYNNQAISMPVDTAIGKK